MATAYPSGTNTFIPSFESSGKLMVDFSRNVKDFPINRYTSIIKVDKNAGYFLQHTPDEAARALTATGDEFAWADGSASRWNTVNKEFSYAPFATRRYAYDFNIGDLASSQADWNIIANYAATAAALAMTQRARIALAKLQSTSYMTQYNTASSLGGGKWDVATTSNPYIKLGLMAAVQAINKATNAVVKPSDLVLVIQPNTASQMAASAEISDYLKSSPFSMDVVRNNLALWGLPDYLYGIQLCIEDTVIVTSQKGAARTDAYALTNTNALLLARPGALETTMGTFSTAACLLKEEMTIETMVDAPNRRTVGRCVEDYDVQIVSPISGFLITGVVD